MPCVGRCQTTGDLMRISVYDSRYRAEAAALFVQGFERQRRATPALPDRLEHAGEVTSLLDYLFRLRPGAIAVEDDRVVGYLGWFIVDRFRKTARQGAYVPEWGHAAIDDHKPAIYRALYRAAAEQWSAAGCGVHAITLLAHDQVAQQAWFWNGFGLTVVDAVRPMQPLNVSSLH